MKTIAKLRWWASLVAVCLAPLPLLAASVPAGTQLRIRMIDSLDSGTAQAGDTFRATLDRPLIANGQILFPKGTDVTGQVIEARPSGSLSSPGELQLRVSSIDVAGASYNLKVRPLSVRGESHARSNLAKIGGGAGAGALIGAAADGGKGALLGAVLGTAAGTGVAAATGKKEARVESESVLLFVTTAVMNVPASAARRAGLRHN